jgi:hypothetical protein
LDAQIALVDALLTASADPEPPAYTVEVRGTVTDPEEIRAAIQSAMRRTH